MILPYFILILKIIKGKAEMDKSTIELYKKTTYKRDGNVSWINSLHFGVSVLIMNHFLNDYIKTSHTVQ